MTASQRIDDVKDEAKANLEVVENVEFGDTKTGGAADFVENTAEEKALRHKIDWYLMPSVWILYLYGAL